MEDLAQEQIKTNARRGSPASLPEPETVPSLGAKRPQAPALSPKIIRLFCLFCRFSFGSHFPSSIPRRFEG